MAPYYPGKTFETFTCLSDAARRRRIMLQSTEMCSGTACEPAASSELDTGPDRIFTQFRPFATTLDRHLPTATLSAHSTPPSVFTFSTASTSKVTPVSLSTSAVVGITLAFVSVLLGLGAMAFTRTRWYRLRKDTYAVAGKGRECAHIYAPKIELEIEAVADLKDVVQAQYVIGEDEETATATEETEATTESQQTCSSEAMRMSWGSSVTSVEEMYSEEEEEEEEVVLVHRAHTQSVEIKRAVLFSIPAK